MMSLARLVLLPLMDSTAWSLVKALLPSLDPRLTLSWRIFLIPNDLSQLGGFLLK